MKIRSLKINNHKKAFELRTYKDRYEYPFATLDIRPTDSDKIKLAYIDRELGNEAFTYELSSGIQDSIHIDRVLEYNREPSYMRDALLYRLTIEAKKLVESSPVGIRELSRRLGTSPTQIYRILDEENNRKSIDRVFELLTALRCRVDVHTLDDSVGDTKIGRTPLAALTNAPEAAAPLICRPSTRRRERYCQVLSSGSTRTKYRVQRHQ